MLLLEALSNKFGICLTNLMGFCYYLFLTFVLGFAPNAGSGWTGVGAEVGPAGWFVAPGAIERKVSKSFSKRDTFCYEPKNMLKNPFCWLFPGGGA